MMAERKIKAQAPQRRGAPTKPSHQESGMLGEHREKLRTNRTALIRDLETSEVMDLLFQEGIILEEHRDTIDAIPVRRQKAAVLLDILVRRGQNAYPVFLKALEETHDHLYHLLKRHIDDEDEYMCGYEVMNLAKEQEISTSSLDDCDFDGYIQTPGSAISSSRKNSSIAHMAVGLSLDDMDGTAEYSELPELPRRTYNLENVHYNPTAVVIETCQVEELKQAPSQLDISSIKATASRYQKSESVTEYENLNRVLAVQCQNNNAVESLTHQEPCQRPKNTNLHELTAGENVFIDVKSLYPSCEAVIVHDSANRVLKVPLSKLRLHGDPRGQPWFYTLPISSQQATLILSSIDKPGCFLVYVPPMKDGDVAYNLSLCRTNRQVVTYHVRKSSTNELGISGDRWFHTIIDLVEFYKQNRGEICCRLRRSPAELVSSVILADSFGESHIIDPKDLTSRPFDEYDDVIGAGYFGEVTRGVYKDEDVAVKSIKQEKSLNSPWVIDDFYEEARILSLLQHANIVRFIGLSSDSKNPQLVTELLTEGDLITSLRNEGPYNIADTKSLLRICLQVVAALRYLRYHKFIIHRDLCARNCLVQLSGQIKLCDFGLAKKVNEDEYFAETNERVSVRWAAPEVLKSLRFSTASDIWSVGVLFWEVFSSGASPHGEFSNRQVTQITMKQEILPRPTSCPNDVYRVMQKCWSWKPSLRPTADSLFNMLEERPYFWPQSIIEDMGAASSSDDYYESGPLKKSQSNNAISQSAKKPYYKRIYKALKRGSLKNKKPKDKSSDVEEETYSIHTNETHEKALPLRPLPPTPAEGVGGYCNSAVVALAYRPLAETSNTAALLQGIEQTTSIPTEHIYEL